MMPVVSVIITTYKRPVETVEPAVSSVLAQTFQKLEILIVDDNPDEWKLHYGLKELENKYAKDGVRYITYPGNHGACYARNVGLSEAKGEYVAFLDDDDEWMPHKLEKQFELMTDEDVAMVYCVVNTFHETSGKLYHGRKCVHHGMIYPQLIMENFIGSTSFPLIRKSCLLEIGGFNVLMQSAQDYDVWLRLSEKFRIEYVNEELGIYHVHSGEQITKNPDRKIAGLERLNAKNWNYLNQNSNKCAKWFRTIKIVPFYAMKGQWKNAIAIWWNSVKDNPAAIKINIQYFLEIALEYFKCRKNRGYRKEIRLYVTNVKGRCAYAC